MRGLAWRAGRLPSIVVGVALTTAFAVASVTPAQARTAAATEAVTAGSSSAGGCDPYIDGTVIPVPCSSTGGSPGSNASAGHNGPGAGSPTVNNTCTFLTLTRSQAANLGLSWPPPRGQHWALMDCLGGTAGTGPQAVLISNATGAPRVTPQQLLAQALGELRVPFLRPYTAPPRGSDGLVGLPEWFWVQAAQWHARTVTVTAGPVWATVTAVPSGLSIQPGAGQPIVNCHGPGSAYDPRLPALAQHAACSYTYLRPSAGQPGNAYRASVTATWRISWTGSGGAGGLLDAALAVPVALSIRVAQGEALVTRP